MKKGYLFGFKSEDYIGSDYLSVFICIPAMLFGLCFLSLHGKQSQPTSRAFYLPSLCETFNISVCKSFECTQLFNRKGVNEIASE